MRKLSKFEIFQRFFIVLGLGFLAFAFFYGRCVNKYRNRNPAYTTGVIIKKVGGWKGSHNFIFKYIVDGQEYTNGKQYNSEKDFFEIGDSCKVIYEITDPSNSSVMKDKFGRYSIP